MSDGEGDDLRARFRALRRHDETATPSFEAIVQRGARPTARGGVRGWIAGGLLAALVIGVMVIPRPADIDPSGMTLPAWRTPTDGLMDQSLALPSLSLARLPSDSFERFKMPSGDTTR